MPIQDGMLLLNLMLSMERKTAADEKTEEEN